MKGTRFIHIALFLICLVQWPLAQISSLDNISPAQMIKFAKNAERVGDYHTAIYFLERFREVKPDVAEVNYDLANLHKEVRNYKKALPLYQHLVYNESKRFPKAQFYYAQMLQATGKFEEAIENYNQFKRAYRGQKDYRQYSKLARNAAYGCDSAKMLMEKPLDVTIENLNSTVNSPHIELSPIPIDDNTFYYSSLRVDSLVYFTSEETPNADIPTRQFYRARKVDLDWIGGERLNKSFNELGVETGNGVMSRDGSRFYFTRCFKNWQGKMICSIYLSTREGHKWSAPVKLPPTINTPDYSTTQPALGRSSKYNNEILYFVSDRPGGRGGKDIWYTIFNKKKQLWSKVYNLGSRINTAADEMTPFYDLSTRTLYYSSQGMAGMGGFDIFYTMGERRKWNKPKNLGFPLNSSYDDLYFTSSKIGDHGFFVSNRPGIDSLDLQTCCDDIFYYSWNDFVRVGVTGTIYPFFRDKYGRKKDLSGFDFMNPPDTVKPLENAIISLYLKNEEDGEYFFIDKDTTGDDGKYLFTLLPDKDYEFRMEGFQYFDSKNYLSTEMMYFNDTIEMPPVWVNVLSGDPIVLENIYYDFNSAELKAGPKKAIDTTLLVMLTEAPEFIIEISSHTDSIGTTEYNAELSQARADNVVSYLIDKGIDPERLKSVGYGASQPVAPNFLPDGGDNPEGREKNRRTEFKIIGTIGEDELEEDEEYEDY